MTDRLASLHFLASCVASQPVRVARTYEQGSTIATNVPSRFRDRTALAWVPTHPFLSAIAKANPRLTQWQLIANLVKSLEWHGAACWWLPEKSPEEAQEIFPLPSSATFTTHAESGKTTVQVSSQANAMQFSTSRLIFFSYDVDPKMDKVRDESEAPDRLIYKLVMANAIIGLVSECLTKWALPFFSSNPDEIIYIEQIPTYAVYEVPADSPLVISKKDMP
jgi:hypothetical protein